jgi:hypothetical protein
MKTATDRAWQGREDPAHGFHHPSAGAAMAGCKSVPARHAAGGMKIPACFALILPTATALDTSSPSSHYFAVSFRTLTPIP